MTMLEDVTDVDLARLVEHAHVLSRTLRRSGEREVGLDAISGSEFEVLRHVQTHPDTTVSAIARALRLQTSNVSTTVRSLQARGLVERVPDPADQRRGLLRASARSLEHRAILEKAWVRMITGALTDLPDGDAEALRAAVPALGRLAAALVDE